MNSYEAIYDHGQIRWISDAPGFDQARILVTVLDIMPVQPDTPRVPPLALKGSIIFNNYDPFEPVLTDADADIALDRTARQITGDSDAFGI